MIIFRNYFRLTFEKPFPYISFVFEEEESKEEKETCCSTKSKKGLLTLEMLEIRTCNLTVTKRDVIIN